MLWNIIFNLNIWKFIRRRYPRTHKKITRKNVILVAQAAKGQACKKVFKIWRMFKTFNVLISSFLCFCLATTIAWWFLNSSGLTPKKGYFDVIPSLLIVHGFAIMVLVTVRRKKIHYKEARREANNALTADQRNILLQNKK